MHANHLPICTQGHSLSRSLACLHARMHTVGRTDKRTHARTHARTHTCVRKRTCTRICMRTRTRARTRTRTCTRTRTRTRKRAHTHTRRTHTRTHAHKHRCTQINALSIHMCTACMLSCGPSSKRIYFRHVCKTIFAATRFICRCDTCSHLVSGAVSSTKIAPTFPPIYQIQLPIRPS